MCDHSEFIREMFILETNAWQTAFRITQKQTIHKVLRIQQTPQQLLIFITLYVVLGYHFEYVILSI